MALGTNTSRALWIDVAGTTPNNTTNKWTSHKNRIWLMWWTFNFCAESICLKVQPDCYGCDFPSACSHLLCTYNCGRTGGSRYSLFGVEVLSVCWRLEMYYVHAKINWCFVIMYIYRYGYKADNSMGTYAHCLTLANAWILLCTD